MDFRILELISTTITVATTMPTITTTNIVSPTQTQFVTT
jgi:hypothetical protein